MNVYFADNGLNIIESVQPGSDNGLAIKDDLTTDELDTGVKSFEVYVLYDRKNRKRAELMTEPGNYILKPSENHDDNCSVFTIVSSELDTTTGEVYVYAEDAGVDLLNEIVPERKFDNSYNIAWYMNFYAGNGYAGETTGAGWNVGINEVGDSVTRKLAFTGESTVAERIRSIATSFDAELSFSITVSGMKITGKYINIYKHRGSDHYILLRPGKEISGYKITRDLEQLATGLLATGSTPEGGNDPINLKSYSGTVPSGYTLDHNTGILYNDAARRQWHRALDTSVLSTGDIVKTYSYETASVSELFNRTKSRLDKISEPSVSVDTELSVFDETIMCGDTVHLADTEADFYADMRVTKLEKSEINQTLYAELKKE